MFNFCRKLPNCLRRWPRDFAFPPAVKAFLLLHVLVSIWCCQCSIFWPFKYVRSGISLCFYFHFLDYIWCGAAFHMVICHLYTFFSEVLLRFLGRFKTGLFVFSYYWILRVHGVIWIIRCIFCNIFSSSVACFFSFLIVSHAEQKILILVKINVFSTGLEKIEGAAWWFLIEVEEFHNTLRT